MATPSLTAATALAASVIRQSLIPMAAFYLILMAALGVGLLRLVRYQAGAASNAGEPGPRPKAPGWPGRPERPEEVGPHTRRGWPALIWHMVRVTVPAYLLLVAVIVAYYYGVAKVGGNFLYSAITGTALLIALSMPVYAIAAWVLAHRRPSRQRHGGDTRIEGRGNCRE